MYRERERDREMREREKEKEEIVLFQKRTRRMCIEKERETER